MAFTPTQLQALKDALASGELEVQFEGKVVRYRSIAELKEAIALVTGELETAGTIAAGTPRRSYAAFGRD